MNRLLPCRPPFLRNLTSNPKLSFEPGVEVGDVPGSVIQPPPVTKPVPGSLTWIEMSGSLAVYVATMVYNASGGGFNAAGCWIRPAGLMDATPLAFVVAVQVSTTTLLGFFNWNVIEALAIGLPPIESLSPSVSVAVMLAG